MTLARKSTLDKFEVRTRERLGLSPKLDAVALLGVMNLTPVQKEYLRTAYVLYRANGNVDARGRDSQAFKAGMRRLVKFTLATEWDHLRGVFSLTRTGVELGRVLGETHRGAS